MTTERYQYLPGFQINYKDGGLVIPRPVITTDSVVIIGTATDGPKWEPVSVYRPEYSETIFGKAYDATTGAANGTTLILGMQEAYGAGCRDIRLVRIGGIIASVEINDTTGGTALKVIKLNGYHAGDVYNSVTYTVNKTAGSECFRIAKPLSKGGGYITIPTGTKAFATVAAVLKLTASAYGVDGNNIQYKITNFPDTDNGGTGAVYKFQFRLNETAETKEATFVADTGTIGTLVTSIGAVVGNNFLTPTIVEGHTSDVCSTTFPVTTAEGTAWINLSGGIDELTIDQLIAAINSHSSNNVVIAERGSTCTDVAAALSCTSLAEVSTETALAGGDNGTSITNDQLYHDLYHAYNLLEDHTADSIVVQGVYADTDITVGGRITNFAEQLANHCADVTERSYETFGNIACSPITVVTQATIKDKISNASNGLLVRDNTYKKYTVTHTHDNEGTGTGTFLLEEVRDENTGLQVYVGQYINVIAMPELAFVHPVIGRYYAPAAAAYAGFTSSLRAESATTNKIIPNARGLRYKLSPAQLNTLSQKRYVTFRERSLGVAVTDGCTAANEGSDYARLSTLRITFAAVSLVRSSAEPFIGEPNELPQRNALETAIKSGLEKMKQAGAINAYRFGISATLAQKLLGESYIDLEIVPALENRKIRVSVALRASL